MLKNPSVIFIAGPTASGKTSLSLKWAKHRKDTIIINADSIQAYKELKIGSAKPDFSKYPKINHYLFDEISAPNVWTAGDFRRKAMQVLQKNLPQKKAFVVGGSGFYMQALEKGMYPVTKKINSPSFLPVKNEKENKTLQEFYKSLQKKDPQTAAQISPNDRYRIHRALDLIAKEGKKVSTLKQEFKTKKFPWNYTKIAMHIPKEELLKKVKKRTNKMLKNGLMEEIKHLLNHGFKNWRPLNSIGYKEGVLCLEGKIKSSELADHIINSTMTLAKKQMTWFKKDKSLKWISSNQNILELDKEIFK